MAQLEKGTSFSPGDTVEAADLNNLVDAATILKGAISEQTGVSAATADYVLILDASDSLNLKKALISSLPGAGTVTSVDFTATPGTIFDDSVGTPTTTPDINLSLANQAAGKVLAGPVSGSAATPSFRVLSPADLPVGTVTVAAAEVDWSLGVMFTRTLTANINFSFANPSHGQTIRMRVVQDASHTVSWTGGGLVVRWPGGTPPVMTTGAGSVDIFTFHFIGGLYYGTFEQDFAL